MLQALGIDPNAPAPDEMLQALFGEKKAATGSVFGTAKKPTGKVEPHKERKRSVAGGPQ